jgi:phosphopantetheine adenylyltransferase
MSQINMNTIMSEKQKQEHSTSVVLNFEQSLQDFTNNYNLLKQKNTALLEDNRDLYNKVLELQNELEDLNKKYSDFGNRESRLLQTIHEIFVSIVPEKFKNNIVLPHVNIEENLKTLIVHILANYECLENVSKINFNTLQSLHELLPKDFINCNKDIDSNERLYRFITEMTQILSDKQITQLLSHDVKTNDLIDPSEVNLRYRAILELIPEVYKTKTSHYISDEVTVAIKNMLSEISNISNRECKLADKIVSIYEAIPDSEFKDRLFAQEIPVEEIILQYIKARSQNEKKDFLYLANLLANNSKLSNNIETLLMFYNSEIKPINKENVSTPNELVEMLIKTFRKLLIDKFNTKLMLNSQYQLAHKQPERQIHYISMDESISDVDIAIAMNQIKERYDLYTGKKPYKFTVKATQPEFDKTDLTVKTQLHDYRKLAELQINYMSNPSKEDYLKIVNLLVKLDLIYLPN